MYFYSFSAVRLYFLYTATIPGRCNTKQNKKEGVRKARNEGNS